MYLNIIIGVKYNKNQATVYQKLNYYNITHSIFRMTSLSPRVQKSYFDMDDIFNVSELGLFWKIFLLTFFFIADPNGAF